MLYVWERLLFVMKCDDSSWLMKCDGTVLFLINCSRFIVTRVGWLQVRSRAPNAKSIRSELGANSLDYPVEFFRISAVVYQILEERAPLLNNQSVLIAKVERGEEVWLGNIGLRWRSEAKPFENQARDGARRSEAKSSVGEEIGAPSPPSGYRFEMAKRSEAIRKPSSRRS